jgi:hypothetical protein
MLLMLVNKQRLELPVVALAQTVQGDAADDVG